MLAEYFGVLLMLVLALVQLVSWTTRSRRKSGPEEAVSEDGAAVAARRSAGLRFHRVALLLLSALVAVLFILPVTSGFRTAGLDSLTALALFALPVCVGLTVQWRRGLVEW